MDDSGNDIFNVLKEDKWLTYSPVPRTIIFQEWSKIKSFFRLIKLRLFPASRLSLMEILNKDFEKKESDPRWKEE